MAKVKRRHIDRRVTGRDDHCTPKWFCERMAKFRKIALDVAGTTRPGAPINRFAKRRYLLSRGEDALRAMTRWRVRNGLTFCNPEYGSKVRLWAMKAVEEFGCHPPDGAELIMLVAARVDTRWFRHLWSHADVVIICQKRFEFVGQENGAQFPQAILYFGERWASFQKHFGDLGVFMQKGQMIVNGRERWASVTVYFPKENPNWPLALARYDKSAERKGRAA